MAQEITRCLFASATVRIGQFRLPIDHPNFENTGPAGGDLLVFPREAVRIHQFGREEVVANCNTVMVYNRGQEYRRRRISPRGDRCEFFHVQRALLLESIARFDPCVSTRPDQPFDFSHGWSTDKLYLRQRRIVRSARGENGWVEPFAVEEEAIALVDAAVDEVFSHRGMKQRRSRTTAEHRRLVDRARELISAEFAVPLTLERLSRRLATSEGHLCRVFRREIGTTLHTYLTRLRLRTALDWIQQGNRDLTQIALGLGFHSHSHFTAAFRRMFGVTPRGWRSLPG